MEAGAQDFLVKGELSGQLLLRSIRYAIDKFQAQSDLDDSRSDFERTSKAKSELLMNLSGEIHSPIYNIIRNSEILLRSDLSPKQQESVESLKGSSTALLNIINTMIDFSKLESGNLLLNHFDFNLSKYVSQVAELLGPQIERNKLGLAITIENNVPTEICGDIDRLGQVLRNLIENAISYTLVGETINLHISLEKETEKNAIIRFSIKSKNSYIPIDKQNVIFESFAQADSASARKYGSLGLGFALTARLVNMMGGRAWLENDTDNSSVIHFTADFNLQVDTEEE